MGKFHVTRSNLTGRIGVGRGSISSRGALRGGRFLRTAQGKIESRYEKPVHTTYKFDSRVDARLKLIKQNRQDARSRIVDARDLLRQQSRSEKPSYSAKSTDLRDERFRMKDETRNIRTERREAGSIGRGRSRSRSRGISRTSHSNKTASDRRPDESYRRKSPSSLNSHSRKEPLVIVTGLGNANKNSDSRSFRDDRESRLSRTDKDHYVIRNGKNTLVTLNNDRYKRDKSKNSNNRSRSRSRDKDRNSNKKQRSNSNDSKNSYLKYEPIKIKITNSSYVPAKSDDKRKPDEFDQDMNQSKNRSNAVSQLTYSNTTMSEDSMDYESTSSDCDVKYPVLPQRSSHANPPIMNNLYSAALLPNPPTLNSMNGYNSSINTFKPPGIVVNNFPTGGMYSNAYSNAWQSTNANTTSHYQQSMKTTNNIQREKPAPVHSNVQSKDGYKLLVSNLHPKVTEDDVLELFSDIGPIKRARFIDKGLAEVVYVRVEHAKEAIHKYDLKELDGRQMVIGFADKSQLSSDSSSYTPEIKIDLKRPPPPILNTQSSNSIYSGNSSFLSQTRTINQNINTNLNMNGSKYNNSNSNHHTSPTSAYYEASNSMSSFKSTTKNSQAIPVNTQSNSLSNRFKASSKLTENHLPESRHSDKTMSVNNLDNMIIQQVLYNKKPIGGNPVTFTVKL